MFVIVVRHEMARRTTSSLRTMQFHWWELRALLSAWRSARKLHGRENVRLERW